MNSKITVNQQTLPVKEYKGKRVVTFKEIDKVHGRADGTAHRNFKANRNRFIEGVDYFGRNSSEAKKEFGITAPNGIILITESGYLMLAKSFTDELAWKVQRELVNSYFRKTISKTETVPEQLTLETDEYVYYPKMWGSSPVLSVEDIAHFTGLQRTTITHFLRHNAKINEYRVLQGHELVTFKIDNPCVKRTIKSLGVVTKGGFEKLLKYHNIIVDDPYALKASATIEPRKVVPQISAPKEQPKQLPQAAEKPKLVLTDNAVGVDIMGDYINAMAVLNTVLRRKKEQMERVVGEPAKNLCAAEIEAIEGTIKALISYGFCDICF